MIKTIFKFLLATASFCVLFIVANTLLPFSKGFRELGASGDTMALLFLFAYSAWTCFAIYFVIKHTEYNGKKLFINLFLVMFFIQYFMTQIETLFYGNAFTVITKFDIILMMLTGAFPLLGAIALMIKFFQNKNTVCEKIKMNIKDTIIKLGIIGIIYFFVYSVFGYLVAWRSEELRLFYTGLTDYNIQTNSVIIPYVILRGILFGIAIIPLKNMVNKNRTVFTISVCLIFLCTAVSLIIPNVLLPNTVRIAHLMEMSSSMFVFGIIVANILWDNNKKTCA